MATAVRATPHLPLWKLNEMEAEAQRLSKVPPFEHDPDWLRLPLAKREMGLARLRAITSFKKIQHPTFADTAQAAETIGLSYRQFYMLVARSRRADFTIFDLIPRSRRPKPMPPRIDAAIGAQLARSVSTETASDKELTPRAILRRVLESWPADLKKPSPMTVRSRIADELAAADRHVGEFRLNNSERAQEEAETASAFGEVLVIDHTAVDIFIEAPKCLRPTVTVAIDLFTTTIVGFAVAIGAPGPGLVIEALLDAEARTADAPGSPVKPRLVLAATHEARWKDLLGELTSSGLELAVRKTPRLHYGGPSRRLIGTKLGDLPLVPRKAHESARGGDAFDHTKHALVSMEQARMLIAKAIGDAAALRANSDVTRHPIQLGLRPAD